MKTCVVCNTEKSLNEFHLDKYKKDGHCSACKTCANKRAKKWHSENSDKVKERVKNYPKEKKREQDVKYRSNNLEKRRESNREYEKQHRKESNERANRFKICHPEKDKEYQKKYFKKHPEKRSYFHEKRRAKKRGVLDTFKSEQWIWLLSLCGEKCLSCGSVKSIHIDHIIALNPGTHTLDNVQPLCKRCNSSKQRKTIDYRPEWLKDAVRNKMVELGLEITHSQ